MKTSAFPLDAKSLDKPLYFVFLCFLSGVLTYAGKSLLITDELYFAFFEGQLSYERITEIVYVNKKWEWISYAIIPLYYLTKISLVSVCIYTGTLIVGIDISFKRIFYVALLAEGIFLIPAILKLCWFLFVQTEYTLSDIQAFYPLSAINFFDAGSLDPWLIYPLQSVNIFEVLYVLAVAYGLFLSTKGSYIKTLGLTTFTYGAGLFIWLVSIMFLTISFAI
jgi:hypothetical protein